MDKRAIRNLVIFIVVVLAIGWLGVWIDQVIPDQPEEETLGMSIWLVVPLLLVIVLRSFMGDGWKDAGLSPNVRGNVKWYLISIFIFPVVTAITLAIGYGTGWIGFSNFNAAAFFTLFFSLLGFNVIKNIFEESVWRGYLTAKLVKLNLPDYTIYFVAGLVWGLWHAPYYLVFLPEAMINAVLPVGRVGFAVVAVVNMLAWTVMFTELFRLTNSIWPVILLHAVEDALINHLVIDGYIEINAGIEILISPICGIVPTLLYLAIGLWLRKKRTR
ncbi:MAG TPA: CPBP family intramembrane metalloprotease [Cyclobacteriaceae bacterium]|nr:CPBP family intramembrane metalloprotease [Cyclobacteriaceae bacterium]HRJ82194.1 CPBP family intramembrane metalloprotease [Cyclobacteriaceae bacterium]